MKFLVLFQDSPSADADLRARFMAEHLAFLEASAGVVEAAGPLRNAGGEAAGGAWIVEADSAEAVETLIRDDPFWPTGLRESVEVLQWDRVFAEGRRLIAPA